MKQAGAVVLCRFPQADLEAGKLRPALLLGKLREYDDWLLCMISSQVRHYLPDLDELVRVNDADFVQSGLRNESIIRIERLAVVEEEILLGEIGEISEDRLKRIKRRLADWLMQ